MAEFPFEVPYQYGVSGPNGPSPATTSPELNNSFAFLWAMVSYQQWRLSMATVKYAAAGSHKFHRSWKIHNVDHNQR